MIRRSDRNPRAEAVGSQNLSNGLNAQPELQMESTSTSSATVTESPDSDSTEKLSVPPSVGWSPAQGWEKTRTRTPTRHPQRQRWNRRTPKLTLVDPPTLITICHRPMLSWLLVGLRLIKI